VAKVAGREHWPLPWPVPGNFLSVPRSPHPVRSSRRARSAAAVVVALAIAGVALLLTTKHAPLAPEPTACAVADGHQNLQLSIGQAGIAATIAGVAAHQDMPIQAVTIAYATALQESKLANLDYGDQDSVGVFQQRPSEGWGTTEQIEDPVYATTRFFAALAKVPDYQHIKVYQAAQDVQRSADGFAYAQYAQVGATMARAFSGTAPHALWCYYSSPAGKAQLAAARKELTITFGPLTTSRIGDPSIAVRVRRPREGWAVASWLISYASLYGISNVRYSGYEWLRGHGTGRWVREPTKSRTQAAPDVVVFG
jgi:hypothetical protein